MTDKPEEYGGSGIFEGREVVDHLIHARISGTVYRVAAWAVRYVDKTKPGTPVNFKFTSIGDKKELTHIAPVSGKFEKGSSTGFRNGNEVKQEQQAAPPPPAEPPKPDVNKVIVPPSTSAAQEQQSPTQEPQPAPEPQEPAPAASEHQMQVSKSCNCQSQNGSDAASIGVTVNLENFESFRIDLKAPTVMQASMMMVNALNVLEQNADQMTASKFRAYRKRVFGGQ